MRPSWKAWALGKVRRSFPPAEKRRGRGPIKVCRAFPSSFAQSCLVGWRRSRGLERLSAARPASSGLEPSSVGAPLCKRHGRLERLRFQRGRFDPAQLDLGVVGGAAESADMQLRVSPFAAEAAAASAAELLPAAGRHGDRAEPVQPAARWGLHGDQRRLPLRGRAAPLPPHRLLQEVISLGIYRRETPPVSLIKMLRVWECLLVKSPPSLFSRAGAASPRGDHWASCTY